MQTNLSRCKVKKVSALINLSFGLGQSFRKANTFDNYGSSVGENNAVRLKVKF